jgi:hypothetical protein
LISIGLPFQRLSLARQAGFPRLGGRIDAAGFKAGILRFEAGLAQRGLRIGGDAHGRAPLFRPVITFLPSRHRSKADRFINLNRRGILGLVGFAVPTSPIRAPLDRFRVGLMAEIPARENSKNTKTSKTS